MENDYTSIDKYLRAVNYLTVAQIFLKDNFLTKRDLTFDDVKPRLLGHWGSGPGINFAYAHLSHFAKKHDQDMMFVLGPGHGFPALQANLFLEGSLSKFYPEMPINDEGIAHLCKQFSWPYGFPSHSNPGTPGVILEGGELGYSLSTSYGAVLDNPDLMVACLIGDGEAETGPLAASWHLNKLVNPKTNGIVLPILHLNGYKISAPTVFGRMSDDELMDLFRGYGYQPRIVDATKTDNPNQVMNDALEWANQVIKEVRESSDDETPHLPMLVLRTLKGWTGVKEYNGKKVEGNCASHQVVLTEAMKNEEQLGLLNEWLKSYKFDELYNEEEGFGDYVQDVLPSDLDKRIGMCKHAFGGDPVYKPLALPNPADYAEEVAVPGQISPKGSMRPAGEYLADVFRLNKENKNFRFMSPDETYSNKLDAIFRETSRSWQWPIEEWDTDMTRDGRVMELLSEQQLQGLVQGYLLTGRHAVYTSYESFIQIVASMVDQYAKFISHAKNIKWRGLTPSLNYILTSTGWRQDHNGLSHQNPGFIDDVLRRQGNFVDVYLPPDTNTTLVALDNMLKTTQKINALVAGKTEEPCWLNIEQAKQQIDKGLMIWDFASDENPDIVLAGAGDYTTKEVMAAVELIKNENQGIRVRCVNISSLTSNGFGRGGNYVDQATFDDMFTTDKPVLIGFHGYPETMKSILFNYAHTTSQFDVRGYMEHGSTTTPFDMHVRNRTSRYHLVMAAFERLAQTGRVSQDEAECVINKYQQKIDENTSYIKEYSVDMPEINTWTWKKR